MGESQCSEDWPNPQAQWFEGYWVVETVEAVQLEPQGAAEAQIKATEA